MYCNSCGHKNPEGPKFCSSCGHAMRSDDTTITFAAIDSEEDAGQDLDLQLDELEPDQALLVATKGPNAGAKYLIDAPVTHVGRHPDSEVFLDDITVSRRHSEIVVTGSGEFVVKDAGSLNGTYVNKERVDTTVLESGDELQIGKFRFVFFTSEA